MGQYLIQFTAYTLAMVGVIALCLLVFKKAAIGSTKNKTPDFLSVENTLSLTPRKTVYVIKAGNEKFLVASDVDKTTFLAKLDATNSINISGVNKENVVNFEKTYTTKKPALAGIKVDKELKEETFSNVTKLPVMKELMRKLNA